MPASPIRKLVPFVENPKKEGKTVFHLNIGQLDIHTPDLILNAYKNHDLKVLKEDDFKNAMECLKEALKVYKGSKVAYDELVIVNV